MTDCLVHCISKQAIYQIYIIMSETLIMSLWHYDIRAGECHTTADSSHAAFQHFRCLMQSFALRCGKSAQGLSAWHLRLGSHCVTFFFLLKDWPEWNTNYQSPTRHWSLHFKATQTLFYLQHRVRRLAEPVKWRQKCLSRTFSTRNCDGY